MEKIFVSGLYLNKVSDKAPAFIITNQSIHVPTLTKWLTENAGLADEKGYIKLTGMESQKQSRRNPQAIFSSRHMEAHH